MRQINLLRIEMPDEKPVSIHLFWKQYLICTIVLLFISAVISLFFSQHVHLVNSQLTDAQNQLVNLEEGVTQFQSLIELQSQLKNDLQLLTDVSSNSLTQTFTFHPGMLEHLYHVVQWMPNEIQLQSILCDHKNQTVEMNGSAQSRSDIFKFANEGLSQVTFLQNIEIENLQDTLQDGTIFFTVKSNIRLMN